MRVARVHYRLCQLPLSCGQPLIFKEASPFLGAAPRHFVTGALGIVTKVLHMISGQPTEEEEEKNIPARCFLDPAPPPPPPRSPSPTPPPPGPSAGLLCIKWRLLNTVLDHEEAAAASGL